MNKLVRRLKMTQGRLKNLRKWLPIIWKTQDFDYYYLLEIMKFKIDCMSEFFESDDTVTLNAKEKAQRMRLVSKLIQRTIDEYYIMKAFDEVGQYQNLPAESNVENQIIKEGIESQEKCDRLVWKILEKDLTSWWD